jgi:hypothetical protein
MLALKLGLSLVSNRKLGAWLPTNETSVVAWYQKGEGITLNGSDVSAWADSANSYDMEQSTAGQQPAYSAGVLTFVSSAKDNLQTSGQISLTDDFTIGFIFNPAIAAPGTILGDNADGTAGHEFIKYTAADNLRIKIDNTAANIPLDSGTFGDDYLVLTRVSNVLTLYKDGVAQSTTPTLSGTSDIDAIGVREENNDYLDGTIEEIQIYSSSSDPLTTNVNNRLSNL